MENSNQKSSNYDVLKIELTTTKIQRIIKLDKNGKRFEKEGEYASINVYINEDEKEDWKKVVVTEAKTKEEVEEKKATNYLGKGSILKKSGEKLIATKIRFSLNLKSIPANKFTEFNDKNGTAHKSVHLIVFINEEKDEYGNDVSVVIEQDKDDLSPKIYVGNGKLNYDE